MWLSKPDFESEQVDGDADEHVMGHVAAGEREGAPRAAVIAG